MPEPPSFHAEMRQLLRERTLDTARTLVCAEGWGAVNMSRVAKEVGISRPVLYKEIGTRRSLAEALIEREADEFLRGVVNCLAAQPSDPVAGLVDAAEFTLHSGTDNALLKAILSGERGDGLLPLLATEPEPVLARAIEVLYAAVRAQYGLPALDEPRLRSAVEVVVRIVLSHLFQPLGTVDHATEQIRQIAASLLDPNPAATGDHNAHPRPQRPHPDKPP